MILSGRLSRLSRSLMLSPNYPADLHFFPRGFLMAVQSCRILSNYRVLLSFYQSPEKGLPLFRPIPRSPHDLYLRLPGVKPSDERRPFFYCPFAGPNNIFASLGQSVVLSSPCHLFPFPAPQNLYPSPVQIILKHPPSACRGASFLSLSVLSKLVVSGEKSLKGYPTISFFCY